MCKRCRLYLFLIVLACAVVWGGKHWQWWGVQPVEPPPEPAQEQLIEENWISFAVPEQITDRAEYEVKMEVLKALESISITWKHEGNGAEESYTLDRFQPGATEALYKISAELGNLLPGKNSFLVEGVFDAPDDGSKKSYKTQFDLPFVLADYSEVKAEWISFVDPLMETDADAVQINGIMKSGADSMRVYSYHPQSGRATFTKLNRYESGAEPFTYNVERRYENWFVGENEYVVEALDESGEVLSRKAFSLRDSTVTLEDEIRELFGTFKPIPGGWFVSTRLPWFALRPVFEEAYYRMETNKVVLPRPTLLYSVETSGDVPLCEYLGGLDYEQEGKSYRGYSFETCQQFRRGVSVYDRFLSQLTYSPVEDVLRVDYQDQTERVSSAYVMIEKGGLAQKNEGEAVSFSDDDFVAEGEEGEETEEERKPWFYVYQMLITEEVDYLDKKIGDIAAEMTEERQRQIEEVKAFINGRRSGDELFSGILFGDSEQ